ncbi:hypothetical protein DPEC_G00121590 [Dallia pectoralis]|uniref:Uncharacterized protein n=1 Tax=Dallia pectoralis TaxID=75939 RepID=A0ACC2GQS9_DALPE|nr:hypothetical protein DPEC_G00121590 [Dallia pectoralis]
MFNKFLTLTLLRGALAIVQKTDERGIPNERRGEVGEKWRGKDSQRKQGNLTISKLRKLKPHCCEPKALGLGRRKPDLWGRLLFEPEASGPGLFSGEPSAGLGFPSPFYSLAMLYDSASSGPHKGSLRKHAARPPPPARLLRKEKREQERWREAEKSHMEVIGLSQGLFTAAVKPSCFLGRPPVHEERD